MAKLTGKSIVFTGTPATMTRGEAANPATSKARLKKLAGTSVELARLVAKNPSTAADYLEELSGSSDKSVRSNIAGNPSSPVAAVMAVGSQFPEQMLLNPSFDLYLLSEPRLLEGIGVSALRALLKRDFCPVSFFSYAARQDDEATQLAVLVNPNVPRAVVEKLCASKYPRVTEAASSHRVFSSDAKPSQHKWQTAFETGLINELANVETVSAVHKSLAFLLLSDEPALQQLSEAELWVIRTAWSSRERADHIQPQDVRAEIASNPSTPLPLKISVLEALAKDKDEDVRRNVASHPSTPVSVLEALEMNFRAVWPWRTESRIPEGWTSQTLRSLLEPSLEQGVADRVGAAEAGGDLTGLRRELVGRMVAGSKPSVPRAVAFLLEDCPVAALAKSQRSSWWLERCAIAQNEQTPESVLRQLTKDAHATVCNAVEWRQRQPVPVVDKVSVITAPQPKEADAGWEAQFKKALSERDQKLTGPTDNSVETAFQDLAYLLWGQFALDPIWWTV